LESARGPPWPTKGGVPDRLPLVGVSNILYVNLRRPPPSRPNDVSVGTPPTFAVLSRGRLPLGGRGILPVTSNRDVLDSMEPLSSVSLGLLAGRQVSKERKE